MKTMSLLATSLVALFAVMIFGCDVENTPVEVQGDSPLAAAPEELFEGAELLNVKDLGGVVLQLYKLSDVVSAAKPLNLTQQHMYSVDLFTPVSSFNVGDPCGMALIFKTQQTGTVSGIFIWKKEKIWSEGPGDFWWEYDIPDPGTWGVGIAFTSGAPNMPGSHTFLGGVKASWGKDFGIFMPSPFPFTIN